MFFTTMLVNVVFSWKNAEHGTRAKDATVLAYRTPGVGMGFSPSIHLKEGDTVELGIEGLGESRQFVKAYTDI